MTYIVLKAPLNSNQPTNQLDCKRWMNNRLRRAENCTQRAKSDIYDCLVLLMSLVCITLYHIIALHCINICYNKYLLMLYSLCFFQNEPSPDARTSRNCSKEDRCRTNVPASPQKRSSSNTSAGTPAKRQNMLMTASPQKYPASPAGSRAVLRSGTTPQKLRQIPTTPTKSRSPTGGNSLLEIEPNSPGKRKLADRNSRSPSSPVSLAKTPVKQPVVVLHRQEFPDTNSSSPAKSPVQKPSYRKSPASTVAMRTAVEDVEQIVSPAKQGRPTKSHSVIESDLIPRSETRMKRDVGRNMVAESSLESSSVNEVEEGNLVSVCHCRRPPVVVVLEDFECFSGPLLQDLITICG